MLGRVKSKAGEAKSKWVDDNARAIVNARVSCFNMLIGEARCECFKEGPEDNPGCTAGR